MKFYQVHIKIKFPRKCLVINIFIFLLKYKSLVLHIKPPHVTVFIRLVHQFNHTIDIILSQQLLHIIQTNGNLKLSNFLQLSQIRKIPGFFHHPHHLIIRNPVEVLIQLLVKLLPRRFLLLLLILLLTKALLMSLLKRNHKVLFVDFFQRTWVHKVLVFVHKVLHPLTILEF